ncbi:hypothetical protein BCR43DRAFT_97165 [Syncephalastrum racemosum]|uniref:Uncharacterized protein n=1 Tax=Syncephalastrum racemosum TaxID=13706 RepID=A0A1X2H1C0_SYNRA|nr:hypothetical protein BCR43DRAFT_97165 [Syncephalastrum racemosum]
MLVEESDWESRLNSLLDWRFAGQGAQGERTQEGQERAQGLGQEYAEDEGGHDRTQGIHDHVFDAESNGYTEEEGWGERDDAEARWAQQEDPPTYRIGWNDFEAEETRWGGNESPRSEGDEHADNDDAVEDPWMEPVTGVMQVDYFPDEYDADMEHENHQLSDHPYDEEDLYEYQEDSDGSYHPPSSDASDDDATTREAAAVEINGWEDSVDDPVPADDETPDERVPLESENNQWRIRRLPHSSEDTDESHQQEQLNRIPHHHRRQAKMKMIYQF